MNYFKDNNDNVFAYDDEQIEKGYGKDLIPITEDEANLIVNPPKTEVEIEIENLLLTINECNQYFDSTRWYNDRFVEQGILMPDEVVLARQECRVKMSDAKARLKELGVEV